MAGYLSLIQRKNLGTPMVAVGEDEMSLTRRSATEKRDLLVRSASDVAAHDTIQSKVLTRLEDCE